MYSLVSLLSSIHPLPAMQSLLVTLMLGAYLIKAWVVAWLPLAVSAACDVAASELPLAVCLIRLLD